MHQVAAHKPNMLIKVPPRKSAVKKRELKPKPPPIPKSPRPNTTKSAPRPKGPTKGPPKFKGPVDGNFIITNFSEYLTELESKEIVTLQDIYYVRKVPPTDKSYNAVLPEHFQFITNEHINYRYQMLQVLGKGSFGGVIKCVDHKTGKTIAIKLLRDHQKHHDQIMLEKDFLYTLQKDKGPEEHHIIRIYETFTFRGFFGIVMELGTYDVYNTLKAQNFLGLSLSTIQLVARQTVDALRFMHSHGIIHCDFKPENILFMNQRKTAIKMIDFGCSSHCNDILYTYIQSRFYRAPEVVFGCEYGPPIDVWGFACVLCEMVTGKPVYEAEDETELMQMYQKILGPPPKWMIEQGKRAEYYFHNDGTPILEPNSDGFIHRPGTSNIGRETGITDKLLLSLITGCMQWDPNKRFTPDQILKHPWMMHNYRTPPLPVPATAR